MVGFSRTAKLTCVTLLASALQHFTAKMIIYRVFVISKQRNFGSWKNKEFA
jgi:hypothetical protein